LHYRLGIDIGSKTAKLVILDDDNAIVFSQYGLHRSNARKTFSDLLGNTIWRFGNHEVKVCITGSAGMRFAEDIALPYVQEVIATRRALQTFLPEADVAIELGGEDAKILFLRGGVEERMNGSCAGGTGGFIDMMCGMLSVNAKQFNSLAIGYRHIYPIASRCAVFAQTDVRPLLNAGASKRDIAASVLQAVVTQTISGLACGRPIEGNVAFLGGPSEVYSELVQRFRITLGLSPAQTLKPKDAHLFVARGAALMASATTTLQELKDRIDALALEQDGSVSRLPMLFATQQEYVAFKARHATNKVSRSRLMNHKGDVFIGIDAGSTTFKLAAINMQGELLYSAYENNRGDVVETARDALSSFFRALPREYGGTPLTTIRRSLVCGYGEELLKAALRIDCGEVETVTHLRAAKEFCPDASFILDIGGQDIKCLGLKDGHIDTIMLNEACSSGCGALIQGFARSLGHTQWTFADEALDAESPVDLGTRCTVFMTSRVRHAQKEGISTANISAGLAYSVVRNALYKVMGMNSLAQLGKNIVVQGGTFMSDAVLRAFELESKLEVVRPDIANLMGAYGGALLARDEYLLRDKEHTASTMLNAYELEALKQAQQTLRCEACSNACNLAVSSFSFPARCLNKRNDGAVKVIKSEDGAADKSVFVSGNRCERGKLWAIAKLEQQTPHHVVLDHPATPKMNFTQSIESQNNIEETRSRNLTVPRALRLGIPPVLKLYEYYPYWHALFAELGFEVLPMHASSGELYRLGAKYVLSESVCYPAKLMHGHIKQLILDGAEFIFMPTFERSTAQECPIVSKYGHLAAHDVEAFLAESFTPTKKTDRTTVGNLTDKITLISTCLADALPTEREVRDLLTQAGITVTSAVIEKARGRAATAQQEHMQQLWHGAETALAQLEKSDGKGMVLLGHPYHRDPGINHAIDRLLLELGYTVFNASDLHRAAEKHAKATHDEQTLQSDETDIHAELTREMSNLPAARWPQISRLYRIARFVANHPQLHLVHLHSFGCGIDAAILSATRRIIRKANKPYTAIKLDEMADPASLRIRLRSLDYALKMDILTHTQGEEETTPSVPNMTTPAALPSLSVSSVTEADVERGLALLNNDLCYPMLAWGGHILRKIEESGSGAKIELPLLCGNCRGTELQQLLNVVLAEDRQVEINKTPTAQDNNDVAVTTVRQSSGVTTLIPTTETNTASGRSVAPRIGVIGNAAMLFTPEFNDALLDRIVAEGAIPVIPSKEAVLACERPLPELLPELYRQGICDFIFVQSFGCLRSHVDARGILPQLRADFPDCNISFLEYDPGISQINQLSRLRLAVTIAFERQNKKQNHAPQAH
jgi:activator of 2-hydroxyglutaryl-CoA dehydratase/predicted nucleotide-binding protein (sugar kinase/HSP70/actin superfamily)